MLSKLFEVFMALSLVATSAFAVPQRATLEPFVDQVAQRTGLPRSEIREHAIETLRESGKFTREELDRIRQPGNDGFELSKASDAVKLLQTSVKFRVRTGLEALRLSQIAFDASAEFTKLASRENIRDVRDLSMMARFNEAHQEVNRAVIHKYELAVRDGKVNDELRAKHSAAVEDNIGLEAQARTIANKLYTALTALLVSRSISYSTFLEEGYAVPSIEISGTSKVSLLTLFDMPDEVVAHIAQARRLIVLPTEAATDTSFDVNSKTLFLGADVLRRIN